MNNFFLIVLITLALALGVVIGEGYAPLSRRTVYMLRESNDALDARMSIIERRCGKLESDVGDLKSVITPAR